MKDPAAVEMSKNKDLEVDQGISVENYLMKKQNLEKKKSFFNNKSSKAENQIPL